VQRIATNLKIVLLPGILHQINSTIFFRVPPNNSDFPDRGLSWKSGRFSYLRVDYAHDRPMAFFTWALFGKFWVLPQDFPKTPRPLLTFLGPYAIMLVDWIEQEQILHPGVFKVFFP
jgi:hypothetical protein